MDNLKNYYGREIIGASFDEYEVILEFDTKEKLRIRDDGQQCCEDRYMRTDDNIEDLIGCKLRNIEAREAHESEADHEVVFLVIQADHEEVSISTHNEHNGFYSGFELEIKELLHDEPVKGRLVLFNN